MTMRVIARIWILILAICLTAQALLSVSSLEAQPGKFDLTLWVISGDSANRIKPGQENHMFLEVRNNTNSSITNIRFSANAPDNWTAAFNPPTLDSLSGGSTYTIDVTVTPPSDASRGDYTVNLIATANETRAVASQYLRVEGGFSIWVWAGIGIAGLVLIAFIFIYLRIGRK
jgi:uncharacterized membrane protein